MGPTPGRIFLDPNLPELLPQQRSSTYQQMAQVRTV